MAAANGGYFLTWEKIFLDTSGKNIETSGNVYALMVTDTYAPNFETHDFRDDITNEVSGTNYTAGGKTTGASNAITFDTNSWKWDCADIVWSAADITSAEAAVYYIVVGAAATDQLWVMQDFGAPYTSTADDFTIQEPATGVARITLTGI